MSESHQKLSIAEQHTIELLVDAVRALGMPRSVGEIYGVLYMSPEPMCMDDIMRKLGISAGSASQGLRQLKSFKAIRTTYIQGQRKDYYIAENRLRELSARFIKEEIAPRLDANCKRIQEIEALLDDEDEAVREHQKKQLNHLHRWQKNGLRILNVMNKFL